VADYDVDSIKQAVSLLAVIEEHVEGVRRAGDHHVCPCPFHNEKTPSFHVYSDHYHCYGCGEHGDVVSFVQKIRGISFRESLKVLSGETSTWQHSNRAATVVTTQPAAEDRVLSPDDRERMITALRMTQSFYEQERGKSRSAKTYLEVERGILTGACAAYGAGYAPKGFGLTQYLKERGISEEVALKAGVLAYSSRTGKTYPQLQERITFPIYNSSGEVVGFGGRALEDAQSVPKYLNTPQTPLFDKSALLFGLLQAQRAIETKKFAILCEGYFDVASLATAGIANAVASCGTAFTASHAELLLKTAERVLVLFDSDRAGKKAIAKMFDVFGDATHRVSVGVLPEGHDPSSFVKAYGHQAREELSRLPLQSLLKSYLEGLDEITIKERAKIEAVLGHCSDPERRRRLEKEVEHYLVPGGKADRKVDLPARYMRETESFEGILRGIESVGDRRYAVLARGTETILVPLATRNIDSVPLGSRLHLRGCQDGSVKCTIVKLEQKRAMRGEPELDQSLGG